MDNLSVSSTGSMSQSMQLAEAQVRMMKKQMDAQGEAALTLINSLSVANVGPNVGRNLNVVA